MTQTEKLIVKNLIKSLKDSTDAGWNSGDIHDWSDWAGKMRNVILTSTGVLDALVSDENPTQKEE